LRYPGERRSIEEIDRAARGHGLLNAIVEDGVVRRLPAVAQVGDALMPTLGIELLRVAAGEPGFGVHVNSGGVEAVRVGDLVVPTQPDGGVWLRYAPHDPARFVSAGDVLAREVDARTFEGKLVLIGVTALGLTDSQATPVGERMPGVEIHAQLIESIYDGALLSRPWWATWLEAALLLVAGLTLIAVVPALSVAMSGLLAASFVVATIGIGFALYLWWGVLLDVSVPVLGIGLLFTAMLGTTLTDVQSQRRALRRQVARQREAAARLAGELEAARRIQMGSLPHPGAVFPGETRFDLYAYLEPARAVGGDLYDFFRLDGDRIFMLVGDVAGKGLPGSLFMTVSKSLCKSIALRTARDVAAVMRDADREIARDNAEGLFVTLWAAIVDVAAGAVEYGSAGHDSPYLLRAGGRPFARLEATGGPPLCVVDDFPYEAARYRMSRGEMLCVITDGVTEAMSATGELYGRARLEALLGRIPPGAGPEDVGEMLRRDVAEFTSGAEPADDVAILILRWNGEPAAGESSAR
jgi:serine phosphatase RsbU (regulator of sigma subunit)